MAGIIVFSVEKLKLYKTIIIDIIIMKIERSGLGEYR